MKIKFTLLALIALCSKFSYSQCEFLIADLTTTGYFINDSKPVFVDIGYIIN